MMNDLFNKIKRSIGEKRFFKTIKKKLYPYFIGFILFLTFKKNNIKIFTPKNNPIDKADLPLAERIFKSYKQMKLDQVKVSSVYKPSSLWQTHIDKDFSFLKESFEKNDIEKFLFFLQNFGNWENYLGIENQVLVKKYSKNIFLRKFLSNKIFGGQLKLWNFFNKQNTNLGVLNMPQYGNQNGAFINENFVVPGSFFNQIYSQIIKKYINDDGRNVIADLGGGYGKLAYYCIKDLKKSTYIDLDIPETLILASYYLAKSFPNKKIFLHGENKFTEETIKNFDLLFLPCWEIDKINKDTVEVTINRNSLGEMEPDTAYNYIDQIHRISKYFFSSNHEYFRNNFDNEKKSLINSEYNKKGKFKELIRYPDFGHLTYENDKIDLDSDIFFYIFKKL